MKNALLWLIIIFGAFNNLYGSKIIVGYLVDKETHVALINYPVYLHSCAKSDTTFTSSSGQFVFDVTSYNSDNIVIKTYGYCDGNWQKYEIDVSLNHFHGDIEYVKLSICNNGVAPCNVFFYYTKRDSVTFYFGSNIHTDFGYYYWDFGDGQRSYDKNPRHTYSYDGAYTVTLFYKTDFGCSDTSKQEILVGNNGMIRGKLSTGSFFVRDAEIWLIGYKENANKILQKIPIKDDGSYQIFAKPYTRYIVKVIPTIDEEYYYPLLIPTYYPKEYYWQLAKPVIFNKGIQDIDLTIDAVYFENIGNNTISGNLLSDSDKSLDYISIYLTNENKTPINFSTVKEGKYSFKHIPNGKYYIFPECPGKVSRYIPIEFTENSSHVININFNVNNTHITPLSIVEPKNSELSIFPTPVSKKLNIRSTSSLNYIDIYSLAGKKIKHIECNFKFNISIDVCEMPSSMYFMRIYTDSKTTINKTFIKK